VIIVIEPASQADVDIAIGEAEDTNPHGKTPHAVAIGRLGGMKGGKARSEKLTPVRDIGSPRRPQDLAGNQKVIFEQIF
jgi:hypothetical protein